MGCFLAAPGSLQSASSVVENATALDGGATFFYKAVCRVEKINRIGCGINQAQDSSPAILPHNKRNEQRRKAHHIDAETRRSAADR